MPKSKMTKVVPVIAFGLLLTLTSCSAVQAGSEDDVREVASLTCGPLEDTLSLKVGLTPTIGFANLLASEALGHFADEGLDVEIVQVSTADSIPLLARGDLDVSAVAVSGGILNAINSGLPVKMVSTGGQFPVEGFDEDGPVPGGFYVRSELVESGEVTTLADLEGRVVGMTGAPGAGNSVLVAYYLDQGGLTWSDVELTTVNYADLQTAFSSGVVDAAVAPAGFSAFLKETGAAVDLSDHGELQGLAISYVYGPSLMEENPEVGDRFMRAILRTNDLLTDTYYEDEELVDAIAASGFFDAETVSTTAPYEYDRPDITERQIGLLQEILLSVDGLLDYDKPLPFADVATNDILERARASKEACFG